MSTVDQSKPSRPPKPAAEPRASLAWRRWRRIGLTVGGLVLLVYLAPAIVAHTPLLNWMLRTAVPIKGQVQCGGAALGWFTPLSLQNVEVRDRRGEPVAAIAAVQIDKSLWSLLANSHDLGRVQVQRPVVYVVAHDKGSNLEDALEPLWSQPKDPKAPPVAVRVELTNGTVIVRDQASGAEHKLERLALAATVAPQGKPAVDLTCSGSVAAGGRSASLKAVLKITPPDANAGGMGSGQLRLDTDALPLAMLQPLLRRALAGASLSGSLTAKLSAAWGEGQGGNAGSVEGEIAASGLALGAAALGTDRIALDQLRAPCRLALRDGVLHVEQLSVDCDLGHLSLEGTARLGELVAGPLLAALSRQEGKLSGRLNLALFAQLLPATLRLKQDTMITDGQVDLTLVSQRSGNRQGWSGSLHTSNITARSQGRQVAWQKPLAVDFAVRDTSAGPIVDRLHCESSFLVADASGTLDDLSAAAQFDVAQLATELAQFVDLGKLQLAGTGRADLRWTRAADDQFQLFAKLEATDFQLQDWQFAGHGVVGGRIAVSSGGVAISNLSVAIDELKARGPGVFLDEPRATLAADARWDTARRELTVERGQLAAGSLQVNVDKSQLNFPAGGGLRGAGSARWQADLAKVVRSLNAGPRAPQWSLAGQLAGQVTWNQQGDSTRAQLDAAVERFEWLTVGAASPTVAQPSSSKRRRGARDPLPAAQPMPPVQSAWREPRIVLALSAALERGGELRLEKARLASESLAIEATGKLSGDSKQRSVDLRGTLEYDWQRLAPLWQAWLGDELRVAGRQSRPFYVRGTIPTEPATGKSLAGLLAEASVGWTGADAYGFFLGAGELKAALRDGTVAIAPLDLPVNGGRLTLSPRLLLEPRLELNLPKGPLVSHLRITPQMCARGLKYILPPLADATIANGELSIALDGARLPLDELARGDVGGQLTIHSAEVKPGPLGDVLILLARQVEASARNKPPSRGRTIETLLKIENQSVGFRMVQGRVHQRNLRFKIDELLVHVHGSVGLDQSLSLVADVQFPEASARNSPFIAALPDRILAVPIAGTLSSPTPDLRAIGRGLLGQAEEKVRGKLFDELNKQLDRLVPVEK